MKVAEQSMEKKKIKTVLQRTGEPWGSGEKHEKPEHSLEEKGKSMERQKG